MYSNPNPNHTLCRNWWTSARPISLGRSFATRVCGLLRAWRCDGAKIRQNITLKTVTLFISLTLWACASQVSNYYTHMMNDNIPDNLTTPQQHAIFDRAGEQIMERLEDFGVPMDGFFYANVIFCSLHEADTACILTPGPPPEQRGKERERVRATACC
jgi:hypothetical protein